MRDTMHFTTDGGSVLQRGGIWFGDPTGRNCANGQWVYIVGY